MNYYERDVVTPKKDHQLRLVNREELEIDGVKDIDSFDNEEFLIETEMGFMLIRGQHLQLKNLNVEKGIIQIKGTIQELAYVNGSQEESAKGMFSKLFK